MRHYHGNYKQFIEQRDKYYEKRMQEYESQQAEIKRLEDFVDKNIARASTSGMAKSRRKTLEKIEKSISRCSMRGVLTFNSTLIAIRVTMSFIYVRLKLVMTISQSPNRLI